MGIAPLEAFPQGGNKILLFSSKSSSLHRVWIWTTKMFHSPKNNEYCEGFIISLWYCIVEHFFCPAEVCLAPNTYLCEHYVRYICSLVFPSIMGDSLPTLCFSPPMPLRCFHHPTKATCFERALQSGICDFPCSPDLSATQ